ncbi:hypothetical protein Tco_0231273 [Tanacetum coccineum]
MSSPKFVETHNVVAFLEKPEESDGFVEIIDFLKESSISYALTVNPVIYTSCIEQFWATAKSSIRRDLHLNDAEGTDCLPTATIFEELARMGAKSTAWNEFSSYITSLIICLATNQKFNLSKYIFDAMVKHLYGGVKFLMYLRFLQVFINQHLGNMSTHKKIFVNPFHTKKVFANIKRAGKDFSQRITPLFNTMMVQPVEEMGEDSNHPTDSTPIPIIDQPSSSSQPKKKQPSKKAQRLEAEDAQAKEIVALKKRIQRKVDSSKDQESLGAPEDASKQRRSIEDIDVDVDDDKMHVEAIVDVKKEQNTKPNDSTTGKAVKAAKPKVVTTIATTATTIRPKDRWVVVQEPIPLKRKDQIALDEQIARDIQAKLDAELLEEQKLARKQEEEANIALIESWENTQAMMEADRLLAERLQSKEREELTDEEKAKLFMELMEKRRKHFAALRAQEKRNRPPTKAQKRTQMSTYLKHMGGYTYKQLKGKSFDEIQKLFDKEMKRVNTFVAMGSEVQESKEKKVEGSEETTKGSRKKMLGRKRAGKEQQQESSKKQKVEEEKESEEVDEVDEAELKKLLVIKKDEDIAIDAIPLATKLPVIIDYKLHKEGMMVHYQLIRADGSSKRYSSMIRMLQGIDREDLEALWRIVKAKYGDKRPENEFERVLWGDYV